MFVTFTLVNRTGTDLVHVNPATVRCIRDYPYANGSTPKKIGAKIAFDNLHYITVQESPSEVAEKLALALIVPR